LVASLDLPTSLFLTELDPNLSTLELSYNDFKVSANGKTAGVIWTQSLMILYDLSSLFYGDLFSLVMNERIPMVAPSSSSAAAAAAQAEAAVIKMKGCFPISRDFAYQINFPSAPASSVPGATSQIECKLSQLTFHSCFPLVFVFVARRLVTEVPQPAHAAPAPATKRKSAAETSPEVTRIPPTITLMTPVVVAIPIQAMGAMRLGAIAVHDFSADIFHSNNSNSQKLSTELLSMSCTPVSGLLCLSFPTKKREETMFFTFKINESWKEAHGFRYFDSVLCNSIEVPPEVYVYGLPALSKNVNFVKKVETVGTSDKDEIRYASQRKTVFSGYKCDVKAVAGGGNTLTTTERQGLPSLFTLKPSRSPGNCFLFSTFSYLVNGIFYSSPAFQIILICLRSIIFPSFSIKKKKSKGWALVALASFLPD
jgi:hypothetical protein